MMRHVQFMESKFGSMANVPEDYPELQLLHNQLDTRTDEELIPEVIQLRRQKANTRNTRKIKFKLVQGINAA